MTTEAHEGESYRPREYWDQRAELAPKDIFQAVCAHGKTYEENYAMHAVQQKILLEMLKGINLRGKRVLEIGSGAGRWIPVMTRLGAIYYGVDISEKMLQYARKRFKHAKLYKIEPGKTLPFPNNYFYLTFSITVLHHNSYDVQDATIREIVRVTEPGGYIFVLEAISPTDKRMKTWFNTYARPVYDWIEAFTSTGQVKLVKKMLVRYWIIRDLILKITKRVNIRKLHNNLEKIILRIDGKIDYYILKMNIIPKRKYVALAALFQKQF